MTSAFVRPSVRTLRVVESSPHELLGKGGIARHNVAQLYGRATGF